MQTKIQGTTMPVLDVLLEPNESVFSESGELSWMTASIQMTTHTQMGGGGGLFGVLKRVAGGGSLFMTEYRAYQYPGEVSFATKVPGHIVPIPVGPGTVWLQTLPISRLAHQIGEYLPHVESRQTGSAAGGALLGGIVGSILSGDQ